MELVGVSPDGSEHFVGGFLPIGRTEAERTKNRAAAHENAGLEESAPASGPQGCALEAVSIHSWRVCMGAPPGAT